jgi:Uma2 family endonuclease
MNATSACAVAATAITHTIKHTVKTASAKPVVHRWTRKQYLRMSELGWFAGSRVQLIDGRIIDIPAQKNAHYCGVEQAKKLLEDAFGPKYWVRAQATLSLGPRSVPDPDVAVVPGPRRTNAAYPTTALLVVEVSDSTLWLDRNRKAAVYAKAGLGDYWVVNLVDRQVEVHRDPVMRPASGARARYTNVQIFKPGEFIVPLAAPGARVPVADLFA